MAEVSAATLFDKLWDRHVVRELDEGWSLLHIDRHLLHDLSGPPAMTELERRGLTVRDPDLVFATPDHLVSTDPDRTIASNPFGGAMWAALAEVGTPAGIRLLELKSGTQGIVHVTAPEQGIVLPGHTVICGDSHTCTNGALGALAFGVGTSQSTQALASQVLAQRKPHQMRIRLDGRLGREVTAKDVALSLIGRLGASAGSGFAVEYAGPVVEAMDMEARLTLCNLTVELGAKFGVVAPDDVTFAWLKGRSFVPTGAQWDWAVADWRGLVTDAELLSPATCIWTVRPSRPWSPGAPTPSMLSRSTERCPTRPTPQTTSSARAGPRRSGTWGCAPDSASSGFRSTGRSSARVNSRLSDLRAAASVVTRRTVAAGVTAWVVPGSEAVRDAAEAEGLDEVFPAAGFTWRQPGCSMCVAANGDRVPPLARCVSTSNRNFVGRQGPGRGPTWPAQPQRRRRP